MILLAAGAAGAAAVGHSVVLQLASRLHQHLVEVDDYRSGMLRVKVQP